MSDFDAVLERLLIDPSFPARLAADPVGALAGYDLAPDEADLLLRQVGADTGAHAAAVEQRVSKSSTFGLFASFTGPVSPGPGGGAPDAMGGGAARQGFGAAPDGWGTGGGDLSARSGFGPAPGLADGAGRDGVPVVTGLGDAPRSGLGEVHGGPGGGEAGLGPGEAQAGRVHSALGEREHLAPPKGYHNRVDADGDGSLDRATYRGRVGGGVEIRVDLDGDGRADFVGVDRDLDNRVDFADYDKDHDGVFEKRMVDDDGDGYLDRTIRR